ncbi:Ferritin-like domain-containing protein [Granulicella rosea]|uniref:Ferritin-like domain-containing protein n=1 Tax=Granulicella rosea TaxID=474952 RepID=A0A239J4Q0_9BACT|nr:ferritin-like domain-containing protein [Granulicella rosea]SNT00652.1 Ferritin-like domain-containing protein [Granulicella rosea]
MANLETQILDDVIVKSRRKLLTLGATALGGLVLGTSKAQAATTYTDADILNFALNLEFLEANFYYLAAFGCTINTPNAAAIAAGAPSAGIPITGSSVGTAGTVSGGSKVPFTTVSAASYAIETAIEEGKHVLFLQKALGSAAVPQPAINLGTSWQTLATAANIPGGASYSPYTSDVNFLVGAYVFEDVGVTAYHGAASLLTSAGNLSAAAGILSVEAYHAGLVRTTINTLDPTNTGAGSYTTLISNLRATLSNAALLGASGGTYDTNPDDFGLATFTTGALGAGGSTATATRLTDADQTNVIAFSRNTTQVLNIVTGGGAVANGAVKSPATGVFYPAGMNGLFK